MASSAESAPSGHAVPRRRKKYVPAVTPRLRVVLVMVFGLFALLAANSVYLASITVLEAVTQKTYQDYFYLLNFLLHLVLGFLLLLPFTIFAFFHTLATMKRRNRVAVRMGYALLSVCVILLVSGILLTRIAGIFELKQPFVRQAVYWAHVIAPLAGIWLYWLHRLAGPPIKWRVGLSYGGIVAAVVVAMLFVKSQDPQKWATAGSPESATYFEPSLARTRDGDFIAADVLMNDQYCLDCHKDIYDDWSHSAHKFSSFNNPAYLTSIAELRDDLMERDGDVNASRWCAGCHDPVPFFSGKFDNPDYDMYKDPTAHAGITCTVCHAITHVNSSKGNADYTIEAPVHYPFANSKNPALKWVNQQLVKAKPGFHKKVFLKPLHETPEFCSGCHKVHLPKELNHYKDFLRGQNHFDSYWLSGVSGRGIRSFYYPPEAQTNCNECHMPSKSSDDFGSEMVDGELKVHDHLFPSANTAMAWWKGKTDIIDRHREFETGVMRVDLFGIKEGDDVTQPLIGPLRPEIPTLTPGKTYLLETVIRTMKMGHHFTQGTVDSNEIWMDVTVIEGAKYDEAGERVAGKIVGRSGGMNDQKAVDPWSHFVNVFMLDRNGFRINRRNAHDIFVPLYNHQIPPGAGQVVHYLMDVAPETRAPLTVEVKLQYRKFDQEYMSLIAEFHRNKGLPLRGVDDTGQDVNHLPVLTLAEDRVTFPVEQMEGEWAIENPDRDIPQWQRWNDYGIGLLLESLKGSGRGELKQAASAFAEVEKADQYHGPINLARTYNVDGQNDKATEALERAVEYKDVDGYPAWTVLWLNALIKRKQNDIAGAVEDFRAAINYRSEATVARKFDFTGDYVVINELSQSLYDLALQQRGKAGMQRRVDMLDEALEWTDRTLEIDRENLEAHYLRYQVFQQLENLAEPESEESEEYRQKSDFHLKQAEKYRPDFNARDSAVAAARKRYPAGNEASEELVIYRLNRAGAFELPATAASASEGDEAETVSEGDQPLGELKVSASE